MHKEKPKMTMMSACKRLTTQAVQNMLVIIFKRYLIFKQM